MRRPTGKLPPMAPPSDLRSKLTKEVRLWILAAVCAAIGAAAVSISDSLPIGVVALLASLLILGPILYWYEKRRQHEQEKPHR